MTVGQLINYLKGFDKDTRVVVKDTTKNAFSLDFVELDEDQLGTITARPLDVHPLSPSRNVYEANTNAHKDTVKVLTLNCKPKVY